MLQNLRFVKIHFYINITKIYDLIRQSVNFKEKSTFSGKIHLVKPQIKKIIFMKKLKRKFYNLVTFCSMTNISSQIKEKLNLN